MHRFLTFESAEDATANRPRLDEGSCLRLMKRLKVDPAPYEADSALRGIAQPIAIASGSGAVQLPPLLPQLPVLQPPAHGPRNAIILQDLPVLFPPLEQEPSQVVQVFSEREMRRGINAIDLEAGQRDSPEIQSKFSR